MRRHWRKIMILALALVLVTSLMSCDLLDGAKPIVDDVKVAKPEYSVALNNYNNLEAKSSNFEGKVVFTVYGANLVSGAAKTFTAGQHITLNRIQNDNRIYVDGRVESCDLSDNMTSLLTVLKDRICNLLSGKNKDTVYNILGYLDGSKNINFDLGYDGANTSYNFKGQINSGAAQEEMFISTNNDYINNELTLKQITADININDYLMFSTFVNFNKDFGWLEKDEASGFFDSVSGLCDYQMKASNDKIYNYILNLAESYIGSLDIDRYASDIAKYNECIGLITKWISIGSSSVKASVNKDNLPVRMQTATRLNININISELNQVIYYLCDDDDKAKDIVDGIKFASDIGIRGINNEPNTIGITIDVSMDETFKYDEESVSLANVDADLFIDALADKPGRISYVVTVDANASSDIKTDSEENTAGDGTGE